MALSDSVTTAPAGWLTRPRHIILMLTPVLLLATTYLVFLTLPGLVGIKLGYFTGFAFYWAFWCFLVPLWVLGPARLKAVFADRRPRLGARLWIGLLLLVVPPAIAWAFMLPIRWLPPNLTSVLLSIPYTLVNVTAEELLWRGTYVAAYPGNVWLGYIYPTLGFAVWHLSPQVVFPNTMPGGAWSFVFGALLWGLAWGWIAFRTRSIRWTSVSHFFLDYAGLGAGLYLK